MGNTNVVLSVSIDFPINSKQDVPFHCIAYDYSCADWNGLCDQLKDVLVENIFELGASAAASEICEWFRLELRVRQLAYIAYVRTPTFIIIVLDMRTLACMLIFSLSFLKFFKIFLVLVTLYCLKLYIVFPWKRQILYCLHLL